MAKYTITAETSLVDQPMTIDADTPMKAAMVAGYRIWGLPRDMPGQPQYGEASLRATLVDVQGGARLYEIGPTHCTGQYGRIWVSAH